MTRCRWASLCSITRTFGHSSIESQGCSSIGRALVSKTSGWEFESPRPCHYSDARLGRQWNCRSQRRDEEVAFRWAHSFKNCCTSAFTSGAKAALRGRSRSPRWRWRSRSGLLRLSSMHGRQRAARGSIAVCRACCCWSACGWRTGWSTFPAFADFLIAVEAEMNKVSWPTRTELFRASMVVLIVIFALAVVLAGYDMFWKRVAVAEIGHPLGTVA